MHQEATNWQTIIENWWDQQLFWGVKEAKHLQLIIDKKEERPSVLYRHSSFNTFFLGPEKTVLKKNHAVGGIF